MGNGSRLSRRCARSARNLRTPMRCPGSGVAHQRRHVHANGCDVTLHSSAWSQGATMRALFVAHYLGEIGQLCPAREGFFAHSRNPLYLGNLLGILGLLIIHNSPWAYAIGVLDELRLPRMRARTAESRHCVVIRGETPAILEAQGRLSLPARSPPNGEPCPVVSRRGASTLRTGSPTAVGGYARKACVCLSNGAAGFFHPA